MDDDELMRRIANDDINAFDILVEKWERRVLNTIYRITGDLESAQDVRQEVFLKIYQSAKHYRPKGQFETWLYRIIINCSINELKRRKRSRMFESLSQVSDEQRSGDNETNALQSQPDQEAQGDQIAKLVQDAILKLPREQRIVVILRHYEGMKFAQIASILKCPIGTVKSRLRSGLEQLRIMLKDIA